MTAETIEHVAQLFEEHGSIIWWQREAKDLCQKDLRIQVHQMANLQKKLTSWTSGLTQVHHGMGLWSTVQNSNTQPTLYLEGSDQYRGWFNSSLITSVANHGVAPYKQILSQGLP